MRSADDRTSNVILKKTIQLRGDPDAPTTTWLDVASMLPATTKGVLELRLFGVGVQASSRILLTNMSLVAKKTSPVGKPYDQTVQVWALGMEDAEPLDGVDVSLVRKSGKVVARCSTSGASGCRLTANADADPDQAEPFALVARRGDDLTYIRYSDLEADLADSSTSGAPYVSDAPYRAAIYSDRGVYRPGDTAHVVAIVRDQKDKAPDAALPIDVKIVDPRAKVVKKTLLRTNTGGVLTSGGFGYWPGATEPLEWATAYATHMLLDAKKAGYAVPDDRLTEVLDWIEGRVAQYERGEYVAHDKWNHYDEQSEAYLHYVLALAGKGRKARIAKLISSIPAGSKGEAAEDLYMLKAALYLSGDRRYEKDLKAVDTSPIAEDRVSSWSFYSDRRRRGLMLSTFFDLFGNDPAGELLAQRVAEGLTGQPSSYYNTQELVWGITGLGKWVQAMAGKGVAAGTLKAEGATIAPRTTKGRANDRTWSLMRASEYKTLTLDVPAASAGMWLVVNSEGVRTGNDYKVGGNGLWVSRSYKQLDGTEIDPAAGSLELGDVVFVEVEVENKTGAAIQNIALVDPLPAGFEIENPRLGRDTRPDWVKDEDLWAVDFMNMRDDHLEAFGTLAAGDTKKVVYTVRVVTSGKFTIPPVEAQAMYDSTLWARAKGGTAVVSGPWTGKLL